MKIQQRDITCFSSVLLSLFKKSLSGQSYLITFMDLESMVLLLIWIQSNIQVSKVVVNLDVVDKYLGLGQYLSEIDPQHHDITWQLQHIIVFCRVHFQRTILKILGNQSKGTALWSRMMSLLNCQSEEDYDELVDLIISIKPLVTYLASTG